MKFRKFEVVLIVLVLLLTLSYGSVFAQDVKITWSSVTNPQDAHSQAMDVFKDEVERLSNGHIRVDLYKAGEIFTQEGELAAVREGSLDMAYYAPNWLAEFVPYLSMFGSAYFFSGYDHMFKALHNTKIAENIFEDVAQEVGVRPLGVFYMGMREVTVVKKVGPVRKPEDLKGVKLRVPASAAWVALGKALGANPTPMSQSEVYMALKTGAIEGQENPLPTVQSRKYYEASKYINLTDHLVGMVWPTINEKKWQSLSDIDKLIVKKAIEKARDFCDTTVLKREANLLDFFKSKGLIVIEPDKEAFAAYAKNSYLTESKELTKNWDMTLYDEVQKMK